jgi:hypothetical protein
MRRRITTTLLVAVFAIAALAGAGVALAYSPPVPIEGSVSGLRVHTGPAGDAFAAWDRYGPGAPDTRGRAAERVADGSWIWADPAAEPAAPGRVLPDGADAVASASDAAGNAVAIWRLQGAIQVTSRAAGGTYGPPATLAAGSGQGPGEVAVGLGTGGQAVALWTVETRTGGMPYDAGRSVMAADRAPDGTWSAPYVLAPPDGPRSTLTCAGCPDPDRRPAVAVDPWGNAVAAWVSAPPTPDLPRIVWSARPAGGAWSPPVLLAAGGATVQLSMDPRGNALASWFEGGFLHAADKYRGRPFGEPQHIGPGGGGIFSDLTPSVTLDSGERALAVWSDGLRVLAASREPLRPWGPPVDLSALAKPAPPAPPVDPGPRIADPLPEPALLQRVRISPGTLRRPACALRTARRACRTGGAALTFRLSSPGEVRVTVQRRGKGRALRGLRVAAGAGSHRMVIGRRPLAPGRYTVRIRVTAENRAPEVATKRLLVRPA